MIAELDQDVIDIKLHPQITDIAVEGDEFAEYRRAIKGLGALPWPALVLQFILKITLGEIQPEPDTGQFAGADQEGYFALIMYKFGFAGMNIVGDGRIWLDENNRLLGLFVVKLLDMFGIISAYAYNLRWINRFAVPYD
jgi:hypothetical protein